MFDRGNRDAGPEVIGPKPKIGLPPALSRAGRAVVLLGIAGAAVFVLLSSCVAYVAPGEYGIKEVKIGSHRGIQKEVCQAGWTFLLPFGMEVMHRLPRNIQVLELTSYPTGESKSRPSESRFTDKSAKIQTSDGFYVDVDVTILYRISDPYSVITKVGPGTLYLHNAVLPKAEPILKQAFGELTTEDFYNSPMRSEKALNAKSLLNAEMKPKGIEVDQVLVRYFKYTEEIQKNIELKKLQDQLVFKNKAEAKAATEEAELKKVKQEGTMKVQVALQEGQAYKVTKDAERELYTRKKRAEADLLVKLAEAQRTELKNKAMQIVGAEKMVALKMADVLTGLNAIVIPSGGPNGLNPLDLDKVLEMFGAQSLNVTPGAAGVASVEFAPPAAAPPEAASPASVVPGKEGQQ